MPIHDDVEMLESVTIYTDGAVSGNGTVGSYGGWAVVFVLGKHELEFSGAKRGTTNQRMELRAAIEGLRASAAHPASRSTATRPTWSSASSRAGGGAGGERLAELEASARR